MNDQLRPTQFLLYKAENGKIKVDVLVQNETVWLTQEEMAELFGRDRSVISKHIKNIFQEGELVQNSVVKDYLTTARDGKDYNKSDSKYLRGIDG